MKIIFVVDLGHFKAYRISDTPTGPKIDLIESCDYVDAHGKLSEKVTDRAGRFGLGRGKEGAAKGYGEPHNMALEGEKRLLKLIAEDISAVLGREKCGRWYLAAPGEINGRIIDNLAPGLASGMGKNVPSDLTKIKKAELLSYFD
ncbi:MAG: host attachment protein [Candidatus Sulfobium sp.]